MNLFDCPIVVLDVETTGLEIGTDRVIEFCGLRLEGGIRALRLLREAPLETFAHRWLHLRIDPGDILRAPESQEALAMNHYDENLWAVDSEPPELALGQITYFIRDALLGGWNLHYDRNMLLHEMIHVGWATTQREASNKITHRLFDAQPLAVRMLGDRLESSSLHATCETLGISNDGAHTARSDVLRTLQVYGKVL